MDRAVVQLVILSIFSVSLTIYINMKYNTDEAGANVTITVAEPKIIKKTVLAKPAMKIPLKRENECSILDVFTQKPQHKCETKKLKGKVEENATLIEVGIFIALGIVFISALLKEMQAKKERKAREQEGIRRHSLAEFANEKTRSTSKFGQQLDNILEYFQNDHDGTGTKEQKVYKRGDSTTSFEGNDEAAKSERKPFNRRSTVPNILVNPELAALKTPYWQCSTDSDDEETKGKRVRIIRRY